MKFMSYGKDGGPESAVHGYWLVEIKGLFSIVLLKFEDGSRDVYHEHAFHAISWVLKGKLSEHTIGKYATGKDKLYNPRLLPILTYRFTWHKVTSIGTTWVLSFRGPWNKTWREYIPSTGQVITLTSGRKEV